MTMSWMIAAFLSAASPEPPALQPAPTGRFILCPGNRRCPRHGAALMGTMAGALLVDHQSRLRVPEHFAFAAGSAMLDLVARGGLDAQAAWLAAHPSVQIIVEGHADEALDREAARALAHARAAAVSAYLEAHGVAADRIVTVQWADLPERLAPLDRAWRADRQAVVRVAPE